MAKRVRMSLYKSKKLFTNTAKKTKDINIKPIASRGGIRL